MKHAVEANEKNLPSYSSNDEDEDDDDKVVSNAAATVLNNMTINLFISEVVEECNPITISYFVVLSSSLLLSNSTIIQLYLCL